MSEAVKLNESGWISNKTKKQFYKLWQNTKKYGTVIFKWGYIPFILYLGVSSKKKFSFFWIYHLFFKKSIYLCLFINKKPLFSCLSDSYRYPFKSLFLKILETLPSGTWFLVLISSVLVKRKKDKITFNQMMEKHKIKKIFYL